MRALRWLLGLGLALALTGCGSPGSAVMPDVLGKRLDVALDDIKSAGVAGDVDVEGGGVLGVIDKSNWQVCAQSPQPGDVVSGKPRLTVDRSCEGAGGGESASPTAPTASAGPASEATLTAQTSADLAAILVEPDYCSAAIADFATTYAGKTIEFDANVAALNKHGDATTRYDILIGAGDFSTTSASGPAFQFRDVNTRYDLHFTDTSAGDTLDVGENLHVVARVDRFESTSCLFLLVPISTTAR